MDLRDVPHEQQEQAVENITVKYARRQKTALHDALGNVDESLISAFAVRWFDCERIQSASGCDQWLGIFSLIQQSNYELSCIAVTRRLIVHNVHLRQQFCHLKYWGADMIWFNEQYFGENRKACIMFLSTHLGHQTPSWGRICVEAFWVRSVKSTLPK